MRKQTSIQFLKCKTLSVLIALAFALKGALAGQTIQDIRFGDLKEGVRIVLDTSAPPQFSASVQNQTAIITTGNFSYLTTKKTYPNMVKTVEPGQNKIGFFIKIHFNKSYKIKSQFLLPPSKKNRKYRYVIDLIETSPKPPPPKAQGKSPQKKKVPPPATPKKVIVIDPGHGGQDPGTISRKGILEKNVTLAFAKELAQLLNQTKGYKAYLTRDRDVFIKLRERVNIARKRNADLFISLHADSHPKPDTRGLSIYTLSHIASDKEAERLAAKENKADLFGGLDLSSEVPEVASILIDLTKREVMNFSALLAHKVVSTLSARVQLLGRTHRFANFAVLRALDHPAVLIELGYLSNKQDEKLLNSPSYRKKVAKGLVDAIDTFFMKAS